MRQNWIAFARQIASPVLQKIANAESFEIEGQPSRAVCSPFEALARTIAGLAPFYQLERGPDFSLAKAAVASFFKADPQVTRQSVIDFAYFTCALLDCPSLYRDQSPEVKARIDYFHAQVRLQQPLVNNWLLAMAVNELFSEHPDFTRIEYALRQHALWYKGDSIYGDGPDHQQDYYNSLVVHPFMDRLLRYCASVPFDNKEFVSNLHEAHCKRLHRYARILERQVSPSGTYPVVGRSATYRFGVFYALGYASIHGYTVDGAASALDRVLKAFQGASLFRPDGLLYVGFRHGSQLELAESYISTGSTYACMLAFQPLGLPEDDLFWQASPMTQDKLWGSEKHLVPADKSIGDPLL